MSNSREPRTKLPGAEATATPPAERGAPAPAEAVEVNPTVSVPVNDDPAAAGLAEPAPTAPGGPRSSRYCHRSGSDKARIKSVIGDVQIRSGK